MTSTEVVTIIAAAGVVLVNVITAWRTGVKVGDMQTASAHSADRAEGKLDKIHELTNSNLTAVKADLAMANDRIAKLEAMLTAREVQ